MQVTVKVPAQDVWHFVGALEAERDRERSEGKTSPPGVCRDEHERRAAAVGRLMAQVAGVEAGDALELSAAERDERLMLTLAVDRMVAQVADAPGRVDATDYEALETAAGRLGQWAERAKAVSGQYEAADAAERAGV